MGRRSPNAEVGVISASLLTYELQPSVKQLLLPLALIQTVIAFPARAQSPDVHSRTVTLEQLRVGISASSHARKTQAGRATALVSADSAKHSPWRYIGAGAAIGGAVGLTAGFISKNRSSECRDCYVSTAYIPLFGALVGAIAGALVGLLAHLGR